MYEACLAPTIAAWRRSYNSSARTPNDAKTSMWSLRGRVSGRGNQHIVIPACL